ncbi:MAG: DNA-binding protein WhiA [Clostridia bacterium]|nr:DNA-binding protein WhiA [Clostridia bacterium]
MSFSHDVKSELIAFSEAARASGNLPLCCRQSEIYALFLFCRSFGASEMGIRTEHEGIADAYVAAVKEMTGHRPKTERTAGGKYRITVEDPVDRQAILSEFGYSGNEVNRRLNTGLLQCENCPAALFRGAFLTAGTVTDPEKDYHMEFVLSTKNLCSDLMAQMEQAGLSPKYVMRGGAHVIYFKDSESVEDLLTLMGATESTLELMGTKMYKDMRNRVNRRMNFENANSTRTFDAAYRQIEAIRYIDRKRGLESLPPELRELAKLRLENADYSLKELGENLSEPISRSGVNHRLQKILEFADDLRSVEKQKKKT